MPDERSANDPNEHADDAKPTVAVVGVGAIGAFFAAHLIDARTADVHLCVRRPFDELVLDSGDDTLRVTAPVHTDPSELAADASVTTPADWVLLATKAHQSEGAKPWLDVLVGPHTKVVVLQNGVEHEQRIAPLVHPDATIIPAVVYCGAELLEPGHIVHRTNGFLIVPDDADGRALHALYEPVRAGIRPTEDFVTAKWQKLCGNAVANGITAITGRRMEVMRRPDLIELGRAVTLECITVARAEGAVIDDAYADLLADGIPQMPPESGTSMLYDRLAGQPLEHDAKYGAICRAGRRHGIPTPLNDALFALLAAISEGPPT